MAKVIRTTIDEKGNIVSDLNGFVGDECVAEEQRFKRDLAQFGLILEEISRQRKTNESHQLEATPNPIRIKQ